MIQLDDLFYTYGVSGVVLPDQKFKIAYPNILFSAGGHLVDDADQYRQLMKLLTLNGDHEFNLVEDFGLLRDEERASGLRAKVSATSDLGDFEKVFLDSDSSGMALLRNSYFLFGATDNWAMYLAEYPTILLIGCKKKLAGKFKEIFNIESNGYTEVKDLVAKEFRSDAGKIEIFERNYVRVGS